MLEGLLLPVVLAIIGSGGLAAYLGWLIAKKKAPAERDSIVVQSAETAALSLTKSFELPSCQGPSCGGPAVSAGRGTPLFGTR